MLLQKSWTQMRIPETVILLWIRVAHGLLPWTIVWVSWNIIEGSLEVKLPTIWTDGKAQPGRSSAMEKVRREKIRDETDQPWRKSEVRRSEMKKIRQDEKVGKSRNTVFFQCFVALEGRKVGSLKRRVRRHLGRWESKNCTPLWREAHLEVKSVKAHHGRSSFGSGNVEKVHAVVARSTFGSQKC